MRARWALAGRVCVANALVSRGLAVKQNAVVAALVCVDLDFVRNVASASLTKRRIPWWSKSASAAR